MTRFAYVLTATLMVVLMAEIGQVLGGGVSALKTKWRSRFNKNGYPVVDGGSTHSYTGPNAHSGYQVPYGAQGVDLNGNGLSDNYEAHLRRNPYATGTDFNGNGLDDRAEARAHGGYYRGGDINGNRLNDDYEARIALARRRAHGSHGIDLNKNGLDDRIEGRMRRQYPGAFHSSGKIDLDGDNIDDRVEASLNVRGHHGRDRNFNGVDDRLEGGYRSAGLYGGMGEGLGMASRHGYRNHAGLDANLNGIPDGIEAGIHGGLEGGYRRRAPVHGGYNAMDLNGNGVADFAEVPGVAPMRPHAPHVDQYRAHNPAYTRDLRPHADSVSSAAMAAAGGASAATAISGNIGHTRYPTANGYVTGTLSGLDNGSESSAYTRSTEKVNGKEQGHVDDNHYYNAQSYGKSDDTNLHEAYNKNDEDIIQTPTVYRSKKNQENYVKDFNKNRRETGSGVVAKDNHSSGYSKNTNKLIEHVDQKHSKVGEGVVENVNHVSSQHLDDEDEEIYDSDGLGSHAGAGMHGMGAHGSGVSASATASAAGVSTSAAVGH